MDRRIAKLPPQDRSRFSSWILKFSDVFGGAGGGGGWWWWWDHRPPPPPPPPNTSENLRIHDENLEQS